MIAAAQPRTPALTLIVVPVLVAFLAAFAVGAIMSRGGTVEPGASAPAATPINVAAPEVNQAAATQIPGLKTPAVRDSTERAPARTGEGGPAVVEQTPQTEPQHNSSPGEQQTQQQQTQQQQTQQQQTQQNTQQQQSTQQQNNGTETPRKSIGTE